MGVYELIKGMLLAFGLLIGLLVIGYVVMESISNDLSSQDDLEQETIDAIDNINEEYNNAINGLLISCIFLVPAVLALWVLGKYTDTKFDYSDITGEDIFSIESKENKKEDAVTILKRRFANGEIDSFEYTEKMARL